MDSADHTATVRTTATLGEVDRNCKRNCFHIAVGVVLLSVQASPAAATDLAERYRVIAESWFGGEMYVRCAEHDFKIARDWRGTYIVQHLPPSATEWRTMRSAKTTARGIRFPVEGASVTLDEEFEPIRAQLLAAIAGRPTDGGFGYPYNYVLEPHTLKVEIEAELDVYDQVMRTYTGRRVDFLWNFDDSLEYSVPVTVPAGEHYSDFKCVGR